jgi:hypothetical protein
MATENSKKFDEAQIRELMFDQYRGLLFSIAYRMLGSVADDGSSI